MLVTEYAYYVDAEGADFLRNYLVSLKLDWDLALTRYDQSKTHLVMEEVKELCNDLQKRIGLAKQGQPIKEGQELHQHEVQQQNTTALNSSLTTMRSQQTAREWAHLVCWAILTHVYLAPQGEAERVAGATPVTLAEQIVEGKTQHLTAQLCSSQR